MKRLMLAVGVGIVGLSAILMYQQRQASIVLVEQAQVAHDVPGTKNGEQARLTEGLPVVAPLPENKLVQLAG
ncbi:hypothetical protein ACFQH1_10675 [Lactiplantibacillus daoliensis]|uniref:Uncharacterized protein n=1 Tax=Lactiplantibacillus daoliensis TaxID=2559916 RepID=A0ABW1UKC2_9LACO|nr:hypothetical protein [Lactiplantibacillus daoliensis]